MSSHCWDPAPVHRHGRADRERAGRGAYELRIAAGHALIDAELYMPRSWTTDPQRLAAAGVPDDAVFATKPEFATQIHWALIDLSWVNGLSALGETG